MPFSLKRLGTAGLASLLLFVASGAFAQAKKPAHPAPAAPAQAQPAPAQPAQGPQGPVKIDLVPTQNDWTKVKGATIDQLKKGSILSVTVKNQVNNEITFAIPVAGFGRAFDGPPIDPKVLEEQQKKLQEELQKRAEEERKRLEAAKPDAAKP